MGKSAINPAVVGRHSTDIAALKNDLGIVEDGDTATHTIAQGQYVIWQGALYTADAAIASGTTLAASGGNKNLTAAENGGLNALNSKMTYKAGDALINRRFHCMGRVVNSGNGVYCWITLDKPCTANGATFQFGNIFFFGVTGFIPSGVVSSVSISGNELFFMIESTTTMTPGSLILLEIQNTTITFT